MQSAPERLNFEFFRSSQRIQLFCFFDFFLRERQPESGHTAATCLLKTGVFELPENVDSQVSICHRLAKQAIYDRTSTW
jgi:hypothetical protein